MRHSSYFRLAAAGLALAAVIWAQVAQPQPQPVPPPQQQQTPQPAAPATPAAQPQTAPAQQPRLASSGGFLFPAPGATLTELIDILAKMLKINYILDPRVKGSVIISTYGEVKPVDLLPLLETVLRVNNAAMVKVGDLYRIVPINSVSQLPVSPEVNADPKTLPDDERIVLNLVFLKYATAGEMDKLVQPFLGEGAGHSIYEPANLLILEDNSRNMRRTMELVALFDADTFASQRVRLFDVSNSRPSDLAKELETVFKAYAFSEKNSAVRFIPIDRINTIIGVAPNPGIFAEVEKWIDKLDVPVKVTAGTVGNYVYRLRYGQAATMAMAVMALYSGNPAALIAMASQANSSMYAAGIGYNGTGYGMGSMGGNYGGPGSMGGYNLGYNNMGGMNTMFNQAVTPGSSIPPQSAAALGVGAAPGADLTGSYLGLQASAGGGPRMPHVIPNPFDNTLLVQGTPQDWEQIRSLIQQLDVAPRQVLIDAKIYEIDLDSEFAAGVQSYLQNAGSNAATGVTGNGTTAANSNQSVVSGLSPSQALAAAAGPGGLGITAGLMVSKTRQLLGLLQAQETKGHSRVISAPSIIATDSIPATMNVGSQVPTLASQGIAGGVQVGGSSVFTNTVSNQSSGVTLSVVARVNSSGIVTLMINQQVSAPVPPAASSAIQSPSFSNRSFSTQMTVQDGDTVAIGGIITENHTESTGGVPFLHRIPILGTAFGARTRSTQRTELIVFMTPRVIYDSNQLVDATEEIKSNLKRVGKLMRDDQ